MFDSHIRHTYHKRDHIIKYISWRHYDKKVKSFHITSTNTFRSPWTMMIVVTHTNITLTTMICFTLLNYTTFFAISFFFIRNKKYLFCFLYYSEINYEGVGKTTPGFENATIMYDKFCKKQIAKLISLK